jgi:hypothetical protein
VTRRATNAGAILGAMLPVALCGEVDEAALLSQARAQVVANIQRLPKYTCLQTVHRSRFEANPSARVSSCGDLEGMAKVLVWTDRFKLDVTISQGAEIFSWAGARHFQSEDVQEIVGGGMTGTGDFGPFLMSIFGGRAEYEYAGLEPQGSGPALAAYRYHVPVSASHYQITLASDPKALVTMAYEGKFWLDPQTAELSRMTIEVPDPPRESEACRVETTIDYRRARMGGSDFLLPRLTVLQLWDLDAQRHENRIEYASCREFQSESVFRTDSEPSAGAPEASKTPVSIPPGVRIKIALRSGIDSESSFAGDAIEGQLLNPIGSLIPKGAIVHGRIVRFEREYLPANDFVLGLQFHSVEANGAEVPLTLQAVTRGRQILADRRQGTEIFQFKTDRLVLGPKFISEWKTRKPSE